MDSMRLRRNSGFTLLELSMVVIIIGLIAAGIMVGRDLISTAMARKTVGQIQQVQTAVKTFRLKYNALPGDMVNASELWADEGAEDGDGNGCISIYTIAPYEGHNFWHHLSLAGLIEGTYVPVTSDPDHSTPGVSFPTALRTGNMHTYCVGGTRTGFESPGDNYLTIYSSARTLSLGEYILAAVVATIGGYPPGIMPSDAYYIDNKLDDGLPLTGDVLSATGGVLGNERGSCPASNGDNVYNTDAKATWGICGLWIYWAP